MHPVVEKYIGRKISQARVLRSETHAANSFLENCGFEQQELFKSYARIEDPTLETAALSDLQREYRKFFRELLGLMDATSPADLTDEQKVQLFNAVSKHWQKGVGARKDAKDIKL